MKMKYALVNGERQEPQPSFKGKCQCCNSDVIAKCGSVKIWHWAHKTKRDCDPWWEESEWHRAWKSQFPEEWQEIIHRAESGEVHIADVKVDQGYIIELQHSPIRPEEQQAREDFYQKMIWIIDGTRRLKDRDKFLDHSQPVNGIQTVRKLGYCFEKCPLFRDWSNRTTTVFFDFSDGALWVLLPKNIVGKTFRERYVFIIDRALLIAILRTTEKKHSLGNLLKNFVDTIESGEKNLMAARR